MHCRPACLQQLLSWPAGFKQSTQAARVAAATSQLTPAGQAAIAEQRSPETHAAMQIRIQVSTSCWTFSNARLAYCKFFLRRAAVYRHMRSFQMSNGLDLTEAYVSMPGHSLYLDCRSLEWRAADRGLLEACWL